MDTLTHIALGACIGELVAGKKLGKKAMLIGAIAQNLPDIDFVASFWLTTAQDLVAHRGISHSFLFMAIAAPLLAWLSGRLFRSANMPFSRWLFFWSIQIFIHLFIDAFNAYGTAWFLPFSNYRVTFNTLFVADPLFTMWPAIAAIALLIIKSSSLNRTRWAWTGLGISSLYLITAICIKLNVNSYVKTEFQSRNISYDKFFTTPTPLNILLWYTVAANDSGYHIGYRSVFDKQQHMDLHYVYRNDSLLAPYKGSTDLSLLNLFSRGYYSAELRHDTIVYNDLCFGEILGWREPRPQFSFYYYMQYPGNNDLVVQRGRFARWDKRTFRQFLERIKGN